MKTYVVYYREYEWRDDGDHHIVSIHKTMDGAEKAKEKSQEEDRKYVGGDEIWDILEYKLND
jgi:hypothetical protein